MELVVDASVALKWFLPEDGRDAAMLLLGRASRLHAPAFLQNEFANGVWKHAQRKTIDAAQARNAMAALYRAVDVWHVTDHLVPAALQLSLDLRHPIYDFVYALLAQNLGFRLITADRRFLDCVSPTSLKKDVIHLADWRPD